MDDRIRKRIENATVTITKLGGRGVLVSNGIILTAAHCINWSVEGGMVLGDHYHEIIETSSKRNLFSCSVCS